MRSRYLVATLKTAVLAVLILLLAVGVSFAQVQVNLTAAPTATTLPDGTVVPMWGYSCGAAVSATATCTALNPKATGWSPVVITVTTGQDLTINLTNNLSFTPTGNTVPTSITIVGQLGGGLGTAANYVPGPAHDTQSVTWPTANTGAINTPPPQGPRVQSFSTEVAAGTTMALTWTGLRPGTYLIESGTHPSIQGPMGLYGILVVTNAPGNTAGTAYPGVNYNAEIPLLLSEIDPFQNNAVNTAVNTVGFVENATHGPMMGSSVASFTVTNGGTGYSATNPPTVVITGGGGVGATATAVVDTNGAVSSISLGSSTGSGYAFPPNVSITGGGGSGAQATAVLKSQSVQTRLCGGAPACYPPVVNYAPLYYLINGAAFDKTNPATSLFAATSGTSTVSPVTGTVLVRLVNAGLRMHVPMIVGSQTTPLTVAASTTASAVPGFSLIAEDGNPLPGVTRVQSEVFMAAGKTYDVMVNVPATATAVPVFDRELSLSGNSINRDAGMLAYIGVNGATLPVSAGSGIFAAAKANPDTYNAVLPGMTLTISDPSKGVIANDMNVYGVKISAAPTQGTLTLNPDGTFTYVASATWANQDTFTYCGNGVTSGQACTTVTLYPSNVADSGVTCASNTFNANTATYLSLRTPGVLAYCKDGAGLPLKVDTSTIKATGMTVVPDVNGGFTAIAPAAGSYSFTFKAKNSQGMLSPATPMTVVFPAGSGLSVTVLDGSDKKTQISDYRWIIEEDRTFYVDPKCTTNPLPAGCPMVNSQGSPANFGTNFHTSYMPVVATGCTGSMSCESGQTLLGQPTVCDVGNGVCRPDTTGNGFTPVVPGQVPLDPTKRYYISVLPGDAAQPFISGYSGQPNCTTAGQTAGQCGHGMGGAPIAAGQTAVTVWTEPSPYPPAKLTVFVFEDDWPLNGEHDAGGGIDVLSPEEPGLGGFQITLQDDAGGTGDATGTPTYDMFNQPLTNSLAGTIDPATGNNACPISQGTIVGMIVTCPKYESDGKTLSPMAGQAVVNNLYPGRYGVVAQPGADRIARGEEWLQTNTLDGQKAHDSFMRIGEPAYFQEFGPAGYHVTIGFANPKIINDRKSGLCPPKTTCSSELKGHVTTARMSRPPDERLYGSGSRASFAFTQCYASLGDPDGADFAFAKCDADGKFDLTGLPSGNFKLTIFDQWNDQIVDGISTPVGLTAGGSLDLGEVAVHQWQANFFTRTFLDVDGNGISNVDAQGNPTEPGLALVKTNVRFRDGSFSNRNNTDLNGYAAFNEEFPLFNWYVIETDVTRYKNTGTHVVYDAGGPTDGTTGGGKSKIAAFFANTIETNSLPPNLRVPGAVYCINADCAGSNISKGPIAGGSSGPATGLSTGRIDPPWVLTYGWQGFSGQNNFLEFGKKPYAAGENGGIRGHVVYSSTRPFDDPQFGTQNVWEPLVPNVTVNLYQEGVAADNVTPTLTLVDSAQTSSFDAWAQGFRSDGMPNMNCPGQSTTDPFFYGLQNQPNYLDWYNSQHGGPAVTQLPNNSQYKCYDGMHTWNQLQPAPYDGMYQFPSVTSMDPTTGKPTSTNCKICVTNPDSSDPYRYGNNSKPVAWKPGAHTGTPMLPDGKYVVEVVVPTGFELVKEEDKNILIGDNFIASVPQQFGGLGNVFILPDQASIAASSNNAQNPTNSLGRSQTLTSHEGDTPTVDTFWPCVGASRTVPDYISLFPQSTQVAPFAGATRNLCDRKEVTLDDQTSAQAEFFIWTPTHIASHFTGLITDDFTAEFDPYSPQFGEKFGPAYLPVSLKDWAGNETARVLSDQFGAYNGLSYSTWEVNPPNPTGYAPTMMVTCMNDAGTGVTPDPFYQKGYSQFCYELPFMPGTTGYFDTPVVPTSAFSEGYNHPDCDYPDATPAVSAVIGSDGVAGPWVSAAGTGHTLTITALGDQLVDNYGYSGPQVNTSTFSWATQKVNRHYGFGATQGPGTVTIGGVAATVTSWSDTQIQVTVPDGVPKCAVKQQAQYGGLHARCGQLVITAGNGRQSIDAVTVTVGGKKPTVLAAGKTIQSAIDAAQPGDMIIVPPGVYNELLLMWKPIRLQGVGAASSVINANTQPAGKMNPWRRQVVCLFGLAPDGTAAGYDPSCGAGWTNFNPTADNPQVDRLPLEATVGWTATLNGNLAEQLIEPTLMGAYEGAGITVLAKGVRFPAGSTPFASDVFPTLTQLLDNTTNSTTGCGQDTARANNPFPSNFWCNPSSIDGLSVTNSSQGGGGIQVHGWGHNIEIANNRIHNNQGTLSGGITVGQGEHPDLQLAGSAPTTIPASCEADALNNGTAGQITNQSLPYCFDMHVNVHNNALTQNSSLGDELFSSTPAGAGGATLCNGTDYYHFNYNWVCGNMSSGDGAGVAHLGFTKNGNIEHNSILFNQSTNPTITTNGGGLLVMGAPDIDPPCAVTTDKDCLSPANTVTPSDGTGPDLVINANLIMGNSADSGSGGGLRLQHVNGTDLINLPNGARSCPKVEHQSTCHWNSVSVTNNIITNNVAGWDGGGVSLQDALAVNIVNNTIVSNDSTASAGVLFGSLFAPLASTPGVNCNNANGIQSCPQVAGLVSVTNSDVLRANLPTTFKCAPGYGGAACSQYSVPVLANNVIWQNRSFVVGVGDFGPGAQNQNQQKLVTLYNSAFNNIASTTSAANQTATGQCPIPASYWDIGVRGDLGPSKHIVLNGTTLVLAPAYTVLTDASDYPGAHNLGSDPALVSEYCNGSRVPPELKSMGYTVNPGTNETNAPTPVFSLTPSATVDEGNNWINLRWGPLALASPVSGLTLGNYALTVGSPAMDYIPGSAPSYDLAPSTDFYGNPRPDVNKTAMDIGAVEYQQVQHAAVVKVSPTSLSFGNVGVGTTSASQSLTLTNYGGIAMTGLTFTFTGPFSRPSGSAGGTCAGNLAAGPSNPSCTVNAVFTPTATGAATGTVTISGNSISGIVTVIGSSVTLSGTGVQAAVLFTGPVPVMNPPTANTNTKNGVITVTNSGTGPLTLSSTVAPSIAKVSGTGGGTGTGTASIQPGGTCTLGKVVNAGGSCTINVRWKPTNTLTANLAVTVTDTGAANPTQTSTPFPAN